jgi:hypothetical protein
MRALTCACGGDIEPARQAWGAPTCWNCAAQGCPIPWKNGKPQGRCDACDCAPPEPRPMTLEDRMDAAMADLERRWKGKRRPKAFYLTQEDFDAFMATDPPTVETTFGNNPPQRWTEPAYRDVPVRLTKSRTSRLYDDPTAQGRALP